MGKNKFKNRDGIVYSTDPDFQYRYAGKQETTETPPPYSQDLRVLVDRKQRAGKVATLVTGFLGNQEDREQLGKMLKTKCGVGGTVKDGVILIQGDFGDRIVDLLREAGYRVKRAGG